MTATSVRAVTPTMPLDFVGSKGQIRQLNDGSWVTWNGHDWVPTIIPPDQVGPNGVVEKLADGSVQLDQDLVVPDVRVTGDTDYGDLYASRLPRGHDYTSLNTTMPSAWQNGNTEFYAGAGITWTFRQARKVLIKASITIATSAADDTCTTMARLRGALYTGSVVMTDPILLEDEMFTGTGSGQRHNFEYEIPQNWQADGSSVYVALTYRMTSTVGQVLMSNLTTHPARVSKYDSGAW
jgi:hypothetical protein